MWREGRGEEEEEGVQVNPHRYPCRTRTHTHTHPSSLRVIAVMIGRRQRKAEQAWGEAGGKKSGCWAGGGGADEGS